MISLYSGTPGSGKSLHIADDIYNRLRHQKGSITIGNFEVNVNSVRKRKGIYIHVDNWRLNPKRLMNFSIRYQQHIGRRIKEDEILLVIDEAQILFNTRDYALPDRRSWLEFFPQHRKYGYKIVLISQFDRMLDRQIRCLLEYDVIHRKVKNFGVIGHIIGFLFGGKMFVYIERWYPIKEKTGMQFFLGRRKLFNLYNTYNLFSREEQKPTKQKEDEPQEAPECEGGGQGDPPEQSEAPATTACNTWSQNPTTKLENCPKILGIKLFSKFRESGGFAKKFGGKK